MQKQSFILFLFIQLGLSSCAFLENRTFVDEMDRETDGFFVPGQDFSTVSGDSGQAYRSRDQIMQRTPASYRERLSDLQYSSLKEELAVKEKALSHHEYLRYREYSPYLESDSEKIYYLGLSIAERDDYLRSRGLSNDTPTGFGGDRRMGEETASTYSLHETLMGDYASSSSEVYLGMDKQSVLRKLGKPNRIDIAGDPRYQNERWSFYDNGRVKFIYFESGQVQGWAVD